MNRGVGYNERSWAIDLIGCLKKLSAQVNRAIKDAGGEQTIRLEGGSLFPDVLLFGDRASARILQGWELKMPDTSIGDIEFRQNAETKAKALGLDSFLLWNVTHAHLYIRDAASSEFVIHKQWNELDDIATREGVLQNRHRWEFLAEKIFSYLNDIFDRGELEGRQFIDAYRSGGVTSLILSNTALVAEELEVSARQDRIFRAEVILWWDRYNSEYLVKKQSKWAILARAVISNWIGKILFAHILRERDVRARRIAELTEDISPWEALTILHNISEECNFWTIFSDSIGLKFIPERVWGELKQFNHLLSDLRLGSIDQAQLSRVLEANAEVAVRKIRGQYPTPPTLAALLINLCVHDIVNDRILDPCCGSGTIARAAIEQKISNNVSPDVTAASVFAGDFDPQAVQISTFSLANPKLMHIPLRIFNKNAFSLNENTVLELRNPTNGRKFEEKLGKFQAIASNLPFVSQNGRKTYSKDIEIVTAMLGKDGERFTQRADVAAYLPFSLYPLLADSGRLGIIITNAWLGTDWGDDFFNLLRRYYNLTTVITSGAHRWFNNSDVVTNIIILDKIEKGKNAANAVKFVVLTQPLDELTKKEDIECLSAQIELGSAHNDAMTIRSVDMNKLAQFRTLGLGGNAQFVDCDWILAMPLKPLKEIFKVRRGERRGLNELFYPRAGHGIEAEYIKPLAKSPTDFVRLNGATVKEAFSCSLTERELKKLALPGFPWVADLLMSFPEGTNEGYGPIFSDSRADRALVC